MENRAEEVGRRDESPVVLPMPGTVLGDLHLYMLPQFTAHSSEPPCTHFTGRIAKTQEGQVTCPKFPSW